MAITPETAEKARRDLALGRDVEEVVRFLLSQGCTETEISGIIGGEPIVFDEPRHGLPLPLIAAGIIALFIILAIFLGAFLVFSTTFPKTPVSLDYGAPMDKAYMQGGYYVEEHKGVKITYKTFSSGQIGEENVREMGAKRIQGIKDMLALLKEHSPEDYETFLTLDSIEISYAAQSSAHIQPTIRKMTYANNEYGEPLCPGELTTTVALAGATAHELCHQRQYDNGEELLEPPCQSRDQHVTRILVERMCS